MDVTGPHVGEGASADMSHISIVIPTRNPQQCATLINQLQGYGHHDIVIVHPAGTPTHAGVRHITTPTLVSAARARNLGIGACTGTVICLLDDDVVLQSDVPRWLAYCLQDPHIGMVGAMLDDAPHDGYWRRCMHRIMAGHQQRQRLRHIPTLLMSMAVALRRTDIVAIGGFAEQFAGAAGEDSDVSLRMGYTAAPYVLAQARITHHPIPDGWWAASCRIWRYGQQWPRVVTAHPDAPSLLRRARWWLAPLIVAGAPLLAILHLRHWWRTPPVWVGCAWLRMMWYMGVANALWHQR